MPSAAFGGSDCQRRMSPNVAVLRGPPPECVMSRLSKRITFVVVGRQPRLKESKIKKDPKVNSPLVVIRV